MHHEPKSPDPLQAQVQQAFQLLKSAYRYTQVKVLHKLEALGYRISKTSFNHIINGHDVGDEALFISSEGIQRLVEKELGHQWLDGGFIDRRGSGWAPEIVELPTPEDIPKDGYRFHDKGRLQIREKVDFFATAEKEVIEFGITLNTFSSYFYNRNEYEFKQPVRALLERGVHFRCFLLQPDSNEALLYFNDRKRVIEEEETGIEKIKNSLVRLQKVKEEFQQDQLNGQFEIYTYKHLPCNSFLIVDGAGPKGKMMISHYIYGQYRANCPVLEIFKTANRSLFRRYWTSFQYFTSDAKSHL